jgi:predicted O-methyltransferase YrrM
MALGRNALQFIHEHTGPESNTLETGCGFSTVMFALTGAAHTVIAPDRQELDYLRDWCEARGISTGQVRFLAEPSQFVLPTLDASPLDLVLIDGGHGFPTPYIDWFYTAGRLRRGGHVIVDDTWLWSCQILRDFLTAQPEWKLIAEYDDRTAVFQKLEDGSETLEWSDQPLVARSGRRRLVDGKLQYDPPFGSTPLGRAWADLRRGDFKSLGRKIARRLRG